MLSSMEHEKECSQGGKSFLTSDCIAAGYNDSVAEASVFLSNVHQPAEFDQVTIKKSF